MNPTYTSVFVVFQLIVLILIGLPTLYIFIFALAGIFFRQKPYLENPAIRKIAVLIPGYKEDDVILEVAHDALNQDYPHDQYDVVIIADSFLTETIEKLKQLPIIVIEVKFDKSERRF